MDILGLKPEVPKDPIGQVLTRDGHPTLAVIDLGREVSEALRDSWPATRPFESGGAIDSKWLLPILGVGGTAVSSLSAGNVFLATANPATLMTIGAGVGSAVMGPKGIIAAAPFVAASQALLPVVAPIMLFMTVSSLTTGARLERMHRAIGALSEDLQRVRHLMEVEDYARLVSAAEHLDEVGSAFEHAQRFTDAMKNELALARSEVKRLRRKFGHLAVRELRSEQDARLAVSDINLFVLSSLMDLRADALRLQLTLQDNPDFVEHRGAALLTKVEECADTFRKMLERNPVAAFRDEQQRKLDELGRFRRGLGSGRPLRKTIGAVNTVLNKDFAPVRSRLERWISEFEASGPAAQEESIVIYQERDDGRALRAHHTRDLRLVQVAA